jgi:hypothetical protein
MKLKRRDICIYTGKDFCGLNNGDLVEVLGMDDNETNMIIFYANNGYLIPRGVLPKDLKKIDHINQSLFLSPCYTQ